MAAGVVVLACGPADKPNRSGGAARTHVVRTFPAAGLSRVVFRAAMAREARVTSAERNEIRVTGTPRGGAPGYHPADPKWREGYYLDQLTIGVPPGVEVTLEARQLSGEGAARSPRAALGRRPGSALRRRAPDAPRREL